MIDIEKVKFIKNKYKGKTLNDVIYSALMISIIK